MEYQKLMQKGFPIQINYEKLLSAYDFVGDKTISKQTENLGVLLHSIGLKENEFKFGRTLIFIRSIKSKLLELIRHPTRAEVMKVEAIYKEKKAELEISKAKAEENRITSQQDTINERETGKFGEQKLEKCSKQATILSDTNIQINENNEKELWSPVKGLKKSGASSEREKKPSYDFRFD